jgi:hypothetical protein
MTLEDLFEDGIGWERVRKIALRKILKTWELSREENKGDD